MQLSDRNLIMRAIALIAEHGREEMDEIVKEVQLGGLSASEVSEAAAQLEDASECVDAT